MMTIEDMADYLLNKDSDFDEYQEDALKFAIFDPSYSLIYPALGLASEAGEVADKIKKGIRDGALNPQDVMKELGDVLWYTAVLANSVGYPLSYVADANLKKLSSRKARNKLTGSGDDR
jgi:NTP pyrophosphatase (non-canonical NTP hydrolase)